MAKYGPEVIQARSLVDVSPPRIASSWWKDICTLGSTGVPAGDLFVDTVLRRVGNGTSTRFWHDTWVGNQPLIMAFPRLFLVSTQQNGLIANCGSLVGGVWSWCLMWTQRLFVWEEALLLDLMLLLQPIAMSLVEDRWWWHRDNSGSYTAVRPTYAVLLEDSSAALGLSDVQVDLLGRLWRSMAPLKVIAFSWQLLLDRGVPTRLNLFRRRVIWIYPLPPVLSRGAEESSVHLFMRCPFALSVWYDVFRWFGMADTYASGSFLIV